MSKLKNCPFCGGEAYKNAYDRLIQIGCKPCGYNMAFEGLLQMKDNGKPIPYSDGNGGIVPADEVKYQEFYHADADEVADAKWNSRVGSNCK